MGDINIKQIENLRLRIQALEILSLVGLVGMAIFVFKEKYDLVYYCIGIIILLYVYKFFTNVRLRKKEFLSNIVEARTNELRSQRDTIQAESQKLSQALAALADAQDELVRKERLASIGQLTQGLVDRILNPLNYINNFSSLSVSLAKDIRMNMEEDVKNDNHANFNDSSELLLLLSGNLDKITKHGDNTVRIVKAMEELLKDRSGNRTTVEINELCKVNLGILKRNYKDEIDRNQILIHYSELTAPLTMELNIEQMGKALQHILNNSMYAVLKKAGSSEYLPAISLFLGIKADKLQIIIRDNGVGIEDNIKSKVFSPFFTTKTTAEAAGTGLYLSREVVLNHKGTIEIASEKDRFTEVTISLPIYQ
ncbi:sensor histidine kinase [Parabacteroides bouchesdurhonensis]|uniref:sensor histidine kinase n=1 Tax=Parabacteroides bouchesdurhonensis TaxID=1936995 RepID=UPI000C815F05|nr:ATP-binding protein [Parabacteroides bouchesdurhonensis]